MNMVSPVVADDADSVDAGQGRLERAWRAWLEALASDAEAALGAAFAYEGLSNQERNGVLDVVEVDVQRLSVPRVAVFAPMLSVESDPVRRERIRVAMGTDVGAEVVVPARAWMGRTTDGDDIVVAETHVYLGFVRVTTCRLTPDRCVHWVRSDPLSDARDATQTGSIVEGAKIDEVPLRTAVDAVARALVAQRRLRGALPTELRPLAMLFDAGGCDDSDGVAG